MQAALDAARRQTGDAAMAGCTGDDAAAWEQWETAHAAYTRAQLLAPETADWPYLDGVVLQRLGRAAEAATQFSRARRGCAPWRSPSKARLAEALYEGGASRPA
jgi:Flp pilus assembly protein TadD